jgi:rSAM/selenodomain-associated transferase 1
VATEELLIVFVKNPRKGKVKTRLAESVGDEEALRIYNQLLQYTLDIVKPLEFDVQVWYSEYIPLNDIWDTIGVQKRTQVGKNLGERMKHAFDCAFDDHYKRVAIIGSDCAELTTGIIRDAFNELKSQDTVIGASKDGGYYLLGMDDHYHQLFDDKEWSSGSVYTETIASIEELNITYSELPRLNDVDTLEDWQEIKTRFVNS